MQTLLVSVIGGWTAGFVWALAVIAIVVLTLILRRERRNARRLADRSRELERLSAELLRVNRMKSEFLANVSHELRTPLNAIVGFVDLLREGVYGDLGTRQVKPVERIEASANHLRHLVDQILDLAKMAAGRLEIHREALDLRPLLLDVVSEIEALAGEKGLTLSISVEATVTRIRTDPLHLRQILVNLVGNAIKYTPSGSVTVRMFDAPEERGGDSRMWTCIEVADTGIGIQPSDLERVFEEFEQVGAGPRADSARRGTGLGLAISRRLALALDGKITLQSAPGAGSQFVLWLPVERELTIAPKQSLELAHDAALLDR
ncbi:MAG: HAMP domain-containing histidine kinase [Gemmatimonadota bacterium]|nr:HAMP domain-containing histidine kinase [Gemmatimonadota bacterium]